MSTDTEVKLLRESLANAELEGPGSAKVLWNTVMCFACYTTTLSLCLDRKVAVICSALLTFLVMFLIFIRRRKVGVEALFPHSEVWTLSRAAALGVFEKAFELASAEDAQEDQAESVHGKNRRAEVKSYLWKLDKNGSSNSRTVSVTEVDERSRSEQQVILQADFDQVDDCTHILMSVDITHAEKQSAILHSTMLRRLAQLRAQIRVQLKHRNAIAPDGVEKTFLYRFIAIKVQLLRRLKIKNASTFWTIYFFFYTFCIAPCVFLDFGKQPLWYVLATDITPLLMIPGIMFYAIDVQKPKLISAWRYVVVLAILGEITNVVWQCSHMEIYDNLDSFHFVITILLYETIVAIPTIYANFKFAFRIK